MRTVSPSPVSVAVLCAAGCLASCEPDVFEVPNLTAPERVTVHDAAVGELTTTHILVTNRGTADALVLVSAEGPLVAPDRLTVAAGATEDVVVGARPVSAAEVRGLLTLRSIVQRVEIPVVVQATGDGDGDGALAAAVGGDDCDDDDAQRHPDASERCDGQDDDCDGMVDDNAVDRRVWYRDADGDTFGDPGVSELACSRPTGFTSRAGDCDDTDASRYPHAREVWYDGVDQDCDGGSDDDADHDGFDASGRGGRDCNDQDRHTHPGAVEVLNGRDDDCDGWQDEHVPEVGDLVFTEVLLIGDAGPAFVEITSTATAPLDVVNMAVRADESLWVTLNAGVVAPGARLVVCDKQHPVCDIVSPGHIPSGAERVILGDALDVLLLSDLPARTGVSATLPTPTLGPYAPVDAWLATETVGQTGDRASPGR